MSYRHKFLKCIVTTIGLWLIVMTLSVCVPKKPGVIHLDNVKHIVKLDRWGRGRAYANAYSNELLDKRAPLLAIASSTGIFIYDSDTLSEIQYLETQAAVRTISWSPSGRQLISKQLNQDALYVWDVDSGQVLYTVQASDHLVAWSPNGDRFVTCDGLRSEMQIWDAKTGKRLLSFDGSRYMPASSLAWSPSGQSLAVGVLEGTVYVFDTKDGTMLHNLNLRSSLPGSEFVIYSLSWHPDGHSLAIGGRAADQMGGIVLWEPCQETWQLLRPLNIDDITVYGPLGQEHLNFQVYALAWSPEGRLLASVSHPGWVYLWNLEEDAWYLLGFESTADGYSLSWDPTGTLVASNAVGNRTISIWNTSEHTRYAWDLMIPDDLVIHNLQALMSNIVTFSRFYILDLGDSLDAHHLTWSPNDQLLAIAEGYGKVSIWDRQGDIVQILSEGDSGYYSIDDIAWSPDGQMLAYHNRGTVDKSAQVQIWETENSNTVLQILENQRGFAWSLDGRVLAAIANDGNSIALWNTQTWNVKRILEIRHGEIQASEIETVCTAFGTNELLAVGYSNGLIKIWNSASGEILHTLLGEAVSIKQLIWSPDGQSLASINKNGIANVWQIDSWKLLFTAGSTMHQVLDVAWSPDGKILAVPTGGVVELRDTSSWTLLGSIEGCGGAWVMSADWRSDNQLLSFACPDGTVYLWSIQK